MRYFSARENENTERPASSRGTPFSNSLQTGAGMLALSNPPIPEKSRWALPLMGSLSRSATAIQPTLPLTLVTRRRMLSSTSKAS